MTERAGLSGETAAVYGGDDVELAFAAGDGEGSLNFVLDHFIAESEITIQVFLVDRNLAGSGDQSDTGDGRFSSAVLPSSIPPFP